MQVFLILLLFVLTFRTSWASEQELPEVLSAAYRSAFRSVARKRPSTPYHFSELPAAPTTIFVRSAAAPFAGVSANLTDEMPSAPIVVGSDFPADVDGSDAVVSKQNSSSLASVPVPPTPSPEEEKRVSWCDFFYSCCCGGGDPYYVSPYHDRREPHKTVFQSHTAQMLQDRASSTTSK